MLSVRSAGELKRTVPTRLACFVRDTMGRPPRLTLFGRLIDTVAVTSPCTFSVICTRKRRPGNTSVGKRSDLRKCRRRDLVRTVRVASRPSAEAIRSRVTVSCTLRASGGMSNVQLLLRTRTHGVGTRANGVSASDEAHARKWTSHILDKAGPCWAVLARGWLRMLQRLQEAGPLAGDRCAWLAVRRWVRVL